MKKMLAVVLMAMVLAPAVCFAWSENFSIMSVEDMKKAVCRNAIRLDFAVITSRDPWSGIQTVVIPVQPDMGPDRGYVEHIRVQTGTELAGMFEVGSTVTHLHEGPYSVVAGPSVWPSAAGIITSSGSRMDCGPGDWYVQAR